MSNTAEGTAERLSLSWDSCAQRDRLWPDIVEARDRLADAARLGRWDEVFAVIAVGIEPRPPDSLTINSVRVGSRSGFAPLHQAAWHGDGDACEEMVRHGAWRTLRSSAGQTPADVARERGHVELAERLSVTIDEHPPWRSSIRDPEILLEALITVRTRQFWTSLWMPQLGPLVEFPHAEFWCAIGGFYGGFAYHWLDPDERLTLEVESWSRVYGGSGQRHHIDATSIVLVEKGFV